MSKRNLKAKRLESESFQWLLHSSKHFTTKTSREFLERTNLHPDFLKICVEHRYRNSRSHSKSKDRDGLTLLPTKDLHKILQFRQNRLRLQRLIRDELALGLNAKESFGNQILIQKRTLRVLRKIGTTIGWTLWRSFLDQQHCDGAGVCPGCKMIFFKHGGCLSMHCPCGEEFSFQDAKLDLKLLTLGDDAMRAHSEYLFRRRLLKSANELLTIPLVSHKTTKLRPPLNNEDVFEVSSRDRNSYRSFTSLPRVREDEEEEHGESLESARNPICDEFDRETNNYSSQIEASSDDDFSFSVLTTASRTPSDNISLCDFIYVSDAEDTDELSLSSVPVMNDNPDEEDSYSLLSGCDTVYSLDNDDYDTNHIVGDKAGMILSYCMATKLGISRSKNTKKASLPNERAPFEAKEQKNQSCSDAMACERNLTKKGKHDKAFDTNRINSYFDQDEEDNDLFLSIYDAAKSTHGGRVASRFKGKSRINWNSSRWESHRRPNWSRKRRRKWKRSVMLHW